MSSNVVVVTGKQMETETSRLKRELGEAKHQLKLYSKVCKSHRHDLPWCTFCNHPLVEEPAQCSRCDKPIPCNTWCGHEGPWLCDGPHHCSAATTPHDHKDRRVCDDCFICCETCNNSLCGDCAFTCNDCSAACCATCCVTCKTCKMHYCDDCSHDHANECGPLKRPKPASTSNEAEPIEDVHEADAFWRM